MWIYILHTLEILRVPDHNKWVSQYSKSPTFFWFPSEYKSYTDTSLQSKCAIALRLKNVLSLIKKKYFITKNANHPLKLQVIIFLLLEGLAQVTAKITDPRSNNKYNKKVRNIMRVTKMWNRHEVSRWCWEKGTNRLVQHRFATDFNRHNIYEV